MEVLEHASVGRNIVPFTKFLSELINKKPDLDIGKSSYFIE